MGGLIRIDDMMGSVQMAGNSSALTSEAYRDTNFIMPFMRHNQDDALSFTFQFCHRKKLGSNLVNIHLHYIAMANPASAQNVYFAYNYTWQTSEGVFPEASGWTSGNSTLEIGTSDAFKHKIHAIVSNITPPTNEGYSSILLFDLTRLSSSGNDTYKTNKTSGTTSANLGILFVDIHYPTDRRGSLNSYTD